MHIINQIMQINNPSIENNLSPKQSIYPLIQITILLHKSAIQFRLLSNTFTQIFNLFI